MHQIFAVVDWTGQLPLATIVRRMAADACLTDDDAPRFVLDHSPRLCVSGAGGITTEIPSASEHLDLILHGRLCGCPSAARVADPARLEALFASLPDGVFNTLAWDRDREALAVWSDVLGAKPLYYWRAPGVVALSSTLRGFRFLPGFSVAVRPDALASILTLGHPVDEGSLLEGVRVVPRGAAAVFERGETRFVTGHAAIGSPMTPPTKDRDLIEELDASMQAATSAWLDDVDEPLVSLSGGLDSRLILRYIASTGRPIRAAVWGESGSDDLRYGVQLAEVVGAPARTCSIDADATLSPGDLASVGWRHESFGAASVPLYWRPWLDLLRSIGRPVVHGFLGGPLSGSHLPGMGLSHRHLALRADQGLARVRSWAGQVATGHLLSHARPAFRRELTEGVAEGVARAWQRLPGEQVYHRLHSFNFDYRQRRYAASTISHVMASFLPVAVPLYTQRNVDFFRRLPLRCLVGRNLVRQTLVARFPALARVPQADIGRPVGRNALTRALDRLSHNRFGWQPLPPFRQRPSSDVFTGLLAANRRSIVDGLREAADPLAEHIDLLALAKRLESEPLPGGERLAIVRLFNLCAFVSRLSGRGEEMSAGQGPIPG